MKWGSIFGHESVLGDFSRLTESDKILIGVAYLYRQKRLIQLFDSTYGESLGNAFEEGMIECMRENREMKGMPTNFEEIVPDTDEFPEQVGACAQNLLIALNHLLLFSRFGQPEFFEGSVAMALENIDLISYEAGVAYSYESMLSNEREIAKLMIGRLGKACNSQPDLDVISRMCIGFDV